MFPSPYISLHEYAAILTVLRTRVCHLVPDFWQCAKRWSKSLSLNEDSWCRIFKSLKNVCKENKLKEFHFKFIHRIIVTKRELFKFGIKKDDECIYCGQNDSTDHTFVECSFTKAFAEDVLQWFNATNAFQITPTTEEMLFGVISDS